MNNKKIKIYNNKYEKIAKIGEGTYGKVMFVIDIANNNNSFNDEIKQDLLKMPVFAIKKSKETKKNQNLQVDFA